MTKVKLAFISSLVPDEKKFQNDAFTRSANNVLTGIATSFDELGVPCTHFSCRPTPSYPRCTQKFFKGENVFLNNRIKIHLLSTLNFRVIKNIFWGFSILTELCRWKYKNKNADCKALMYNIYCPPIVFVYFTCKLLRIPLYVIYYDLGVPPKSLHLSKTTMAVYRCSEHFVSWTMKRIAGRIVINDRIVQHYAQGKDFLLVDGGISDVVVSKLFPLTISTKKEYIFVCAGMLWEQNGTKLLLKAMEMNDNEQIRLVFAGKGNDVPLIQEAVKKDKRISYKGMLSMDELFEVYKDADVLLNLRIEEQEDFHFPSKLLEYMCMGKYVVSTPVAHAERDYTDYLTFLTDITPHALSNLMNQITEMTKDRLYQKGLVTRNFILQNRTWLNRTKEILQYMKCQI